MEGGWGFLARAAMSAALEARALANARPKPGEWVALFDGKRFRADQAGPGPFVVQHGQLQNDMGTGTAWTDYATGDRCVIDLVFAHLGAGQAALVFAAGGGTCRSSCPSTATTRPGGSRTG